MPATIATDATQTPIAYSWASGTGYIGDCVPQWHSGTRGVFSFERAGFTRARVQASRLIPVSGAMSVFGACWGPDGGVVRGDGCRGREVAGDVSLPRVRGHLDLGGIGVGEPACGGGTDGGESSPAHLDGAEPGGDLRSLGRGVEAGVPDRRARREENLGAGGDERMLASVLG